MRLVIEVETDHPDDLLALAIQQDEDSAFYFDLPVLDIYVEED